MSLIDYKQLTRLTTTLVCTLYRNIYHKWLTACDHNDASSDRCTCHKQDYVQRY